MPQVARLTDVCTGHGCWPPRPNAVASTDVIVNGRGWHRVGDAWKVHCVVGETRVWVDGEFKKIEDLIHDFSGKLARTRLSTGEVIVSEIIDVFITKDTHEILEIELENGSVLRCTPDHLIQTKDGVYVRADSLTEDDEL